MQCLIEGTAIKADDGAVLQQLSVQLTSCVNTLKEIGGYINKIDNPDKLKRVVIDLLLHSFPKWRDTVHRIIQQDTRHVTVKNIRNFVTRRPVFGKVNETKGKQAFRKQRETRAQSKWIFKSRYPETSYEKRLCPLCCDDHL